MFIGQVRGPVKLRSIELEEKCPEIPVSRLLIHSLRAEHEK